jgi:hypothetical protein
VFRSREEAIWSALLSEAVLELRSRFYLLIEDVSEPAKNQTTTQGRRREPEEGSWSQLALLRYRRS